MYTHATEQAITTTMTAIATVITKTDRMYIGTEGEDDAGDDKEADPSLMARPKGWLLVKYELMPMDAA
jgi:hypothetical protein